MLILLFKDLPEIYLDLEETEPQDIIPIKDFVTV